MPKYEQMWEFQTSFFHYIVIVIIPIGVTRLDKLSNAHTRQTLGVMQTIENVVSERRLPWFGHVARNSEMINNGYKQDFPKERRRVRPPKRWADVIRQQCGLLLQTLERKAMRRQSLLVTHEVRGCQVLST